MLVPDATGRCVFHDRDAHRCRVHRDYGPAQLPAACFHFPRRALIDDRGVFVTLSHFCPTAAALLVQSPASLAIVDAPEAFPATTAYEGLDGREAWPPLVKPTLLFDLASYSHWERYVVATIDGTADHTTVWDALCDVSAAAEYLRAWTPDEGPLAARVLALDQRVWSADDRARAWQLYAAYRHLDAFDRLTRCIPAGLQAPVLSSETRRAWSEVRRHSPLPARIARRYVAAKAFAAWSAYDAFGVRTLVAELAIAALVLDVETARWLTRTGTDGHDGTTHAPSPLTEADGIEIVRAADWLLVHLVDRPALLEWVRPIEHIAVAHTAIDPPRVP